MTLPVIEVSRLITSKDATALVGEAVPESESTVNDQGIFVDADTGEIVLVYVPLKGGPEALRTAVLNIPIGSVKRASGIDQQSRSLGMAPRKVMQGRDACRPASLAYERPSEHAFLARLALDLGETLREIAPDKYQEGVDALAEVDKDWRITEGALWTSGVINRSATLPYHRDGFNFDSWSAMPVVRRGMKGGYLHVPEYGLTVGCRDGWVVFFNGYRIVHGVTPMEKATEDGYRFSVVYYALRGMKDCFTYAVETAKGAKRRTQREEHRPPAQTRANESATTEPTA
jgi:hypothetical protein